MKCLVVDYFDQISEDDEMWGFCSEVVRDLTAHSTSKHIQTAIFIHQNSPSPQVSLVLVIRSS